MHFIFSCLQKTIRLLFNISGQYYWLNFLHYLLVYTQLYLVCSIILWFDGLFSGSVYYCKKTSSLKFENDLWFK